MGTKIHVHLHSKPTSDIVASGTAYWDYGPSKRKVEIIGPSKNSPKTHTEVKWNNGRFDVPNSHLTNTRDREV